MDFRKNILLALSNRLTGVSPKRTQLKIFSVFLISLIIALSSLSGFAQEADVQAGKKLFNANCAACHKLNKKAVGPALKGVSAKYEREWLYSWIKNSAAMIKDGDPQAVAVWEEYNKVAMNAFPLLSNADIDNILAYTDYTPPAPVASAVTQQTAATSDSGVNNDLILGALSLVFILLVVMLFLVQKTLKRIAIASGVDITPPVKEQRPPLWQVIAKNQFLIFLSVITLLLSSAYFVYGFLMQVGIDQGYARYNRFIIHTKYTQEPIKLSVSIVTPLLGFPNIQEFHH